MGNIPKKINFENMPLSSSLAHLAYGDLAFKAWRKKKRLTETDSNENKK